MKEPCTVSARLCSRKVDSYAQRRASVGAVCERGGCSEVGRVVASVFTLRARPGVERKQ